MAGCYCLQLLQVLPLFNEIFFFSKVYLNIVFKDCTGKTDILHLTIYLLKILFCFLLIQGFRIFVDI